MKRILIVGSPAAGKSTAAKKIAKITGLNLIHLDYHYWLADWEKPDQQVWANTVDKLINQPSWIIDGNYSSTMVKRLERADTLIFLDYPTRITMYRLLLRLLKSNRISRQNEFATGYKEKFDWSFIRYVYRYRKDRRPQDVDSMANFTGKTYHFKKTKDLADFIEKLKSNL